MDNKPAKPNFTGIVDRFVMESNIDNDGVRYFAFSADPYPMPPTNPTHPVFYIDPDRPFSADCAGAAFVSWGMKHVVDIYYDPHDHNESRWRVCAVVLHKLQPKP